MYTHMHSISRSRTYSTLWIIVLYCTCTVDSTYMIDDETLPTHAQGKKYTLDMLPDEQLMQTLIQDVENKTQFQNADGTYKDLKHWPGVRIKDGHVVEINWVLNFKLGGSINLLFLPRGVMALRLIENSLSGTLCAADLPPYMRFLGIAVNNFSGTIEWSKLPRSLTHIYLNYNQFSCTVEWNHLPPNLKELNIRNNKFHGSVDCSALPPALKTLYIAHNQFDGVLDFSTAPTSLRTENYLFQRNQFSEIIK